MDSQQRQRALNPEDSFIMQAPAGSGKTSVLAQRMLCLLGHVNNAPEEVVAITFTRKAAAEMRSRILSALKSAQSEPEPELDHHKTTWLLAKKVLERDQALHWNLLNNPNRLRVLTIDALCARITRSAPLLTNFGAQPDVLSDATECYLRAARALLDSLLEDPPWSASLTKIMLHLDNNQAWVEELFVSMLARRDQWLTHVMGKHQREHLEMGLQHAVDDMMALCQEHLPNAIIDEMLALYNFAAVHINKPPMHTAPISIEQWGEIATLVFTASGTIRKTSTAKQGFPAQREAVDHQQKAYYKAMKARLKAFLGGLAQYPDFTMSLVEVLYAPPRHYSEQQWELIESLLEVLPILVAELVLQFQQLGAVDFIEVASSAIRALGDEDNPTEVALNIDYQIQHLLIDEFQDTSLTQYRLLELLTAGWQPDDGRTLFIVGDPMQSIYRFREAEVGLFLRSRHYGLAHIPLEYLQLTMNFRSQQSVIHWINEHFVDIFPHEENIAIGAVPYAPSSAADSTSSDSIQVHALLKDDYDTEATRLVEIIKKERVNDPEQTIAILVRSRSHLINIIPALKRAGIRYQAVDVEKLSHCVMIRDLLSLTRALLHVYDRVAWLAVLRAPWCGLTLADLHAIGVDHKKTILEAALQEKLSDDGAGRLHPVLNVLQEALGMRQRQPLAQWVRHTWQQLNGPGCASSDTELDNAEMFFSLLTEVDQGALLPEVSQIEFKLNRLFAKADANADPRLQIMTIHKAKGLEFDTVIIPALERRSAMDESSLLLWQERPRRTEDQSDLLLAPIKYAGDDYDPIYRHVRRQQNQKGFYESIRLLYVAVTRTKSRLHLIGSIAASDSEPSSQSFLGLLWDAIGCHFSELEEQDGHPEKKNEHDHQTIHRISTTNMAITEPYTQPARAKQHIVADLDQTATIIGTVIHDILFHITKVGLEQFVIDKNRWEQQLIELQLPIHQMNHAIDKITQAMNNIYDDPKAHWLLSDQHADAQAEYPLTYVDQGEIVNIVIDRTFIDKDGVRWIVDYKTSQPENDDALQQLVERYRGQLAQYAMAMGMLDNREIKTGLYLPLLPQWVEVSLSENLCEKI